MSHSPPKPRLADLTVLPIDELKMPAEDVSDLTDVFDAIDRLCDNMKSSGETLDETEVETVTTDFMVPNTVIDQISDNMKSSGETLDETEVVETVTTDFRDANAVIDRVCDSMKSSGETIDETEVVETVTTDSNTVKSSGETLDEIEVVETITADFKDTNASDIVDRLSDNMKFSDEVIDETEVETVTTDFKDTNTTDVPYVPNYVECATELICPDKVSIEKVQTFDFERWSDPLTSPPTQVDDIETAASDTEPILGRCEHMSDVYYTASSEGSLLSDLDIPDKVPQEDELPTSSDKEERKECVIAGHVAAMRERFESMTRTNTPCPDLVRSTSPTFDVFRNITPSPDRLG